MSKAVKVLKTRSLDELFAEMFIFSVKNNDSEAMYTALRVGLDYAIVEAKRTRDTVLLDRLADFAERISFLGIE